MASDTVTGSADIICGQTGAARALGTGLRLPSLAGHTGIVDLTGLIRLVTLVGLFRLVDFTEHADLTNLAVCDRSSLRLITDVHSGLGHDCSSLHSCWRRRRQ